MEQFLQNLTSLVSSANGFIWGVYFLIPLLCGTGLFFTIRLGGVQFTKFGSGWKRLFSNFSLSGKEAGKHGMSSFQAVATAIAAQVGTGNLVGAMTALIMGGPGAIFWMWLAALAGMATNFAEAAIAQIYKTKDDSGQTVGGPAYYISEGLKNKVGDGFAKFLAGFFAIAIILALGFMGNMVQANSISDAFQNAFHVPTWITGAVLAVIAGVIFMGGVKRIASVTEKVVPLMAIVYIVVGLIVVIINAGQIPAMFAMIFKGAFDPKAVWGGALGFGMGRAVRYGVARGLFSNEAGMGSTPHAHAVADVKHPVEQGVLGIVAVFIDTFIVLNVTVFTVLSSGVIKFENGEATMKGIKLVQEAFSQHLFGPTFGYLFIAICLLFFAFSTIIGWYYFGETNIRYLFGTKGLIPYQLLVVIFIFIGSLLKIDLVWELTDFFNGIMVIPNLIALLLLSGTVAKILKDYNKGLPYDASQYK
ncbi:alanine:cation symporter family protein [Treponema sp. OMZ 788]|uniref:alanine/glycine:cation symporter family protein n=1 Tax=Treponema sp. OMZ 788 TaxID=2563664 RepID=UPI0020A3662D|nr:sodium:alanine symporter family protein [Treponema sp. OMZ 788]UTC63769.1 alanine:cation symporter family protein [Treponema sp. OMZ 788]